MSAKISLKELEKNVYQSTYRDGLIDIQIGSVFLMFAIAPLLSTTLGDFWSSMVFLPFWALIWLGIRVVRKKIIQPRIGMVKYGAYRKTRLKKMTLVMLVFNLLALTLGAMSFFNFADLPGWIHSVRLSILVLVGFSLAGYMLEFPRLYIYGVLTALAPLVGEFLYTTYGATHHGFPITFGFTSGLIILIGLVILLRLVREYPETIQEGLE